MAETIQKAIDLALAIGFSHSGPLDASTLVLMPEVRDMCAADKCHLFNRSWMCPPACGTLEENGEKLAAYSHGILVQTTAQMDDDFDYEAMQEAEKKHKKEFRTLQIELLKEFPSLLALGAGGCTLCPQCTYPDEPCRFPDEAISSMEAFGLLVSDVCTKNNLPYYYGPGTLTYTGCFLLK